jgi:hypothetical protein
MRNISYFNTAGDTLIPSAANLVVGAGDDPECFRMVRHQRAPPWNHTLCLGGPGVHFIGTQLQAIHSENAVKTISAAVVLLAGCGSQVSESGSARASVEAECIVDTDCDEGLFCNGSRCVAPSEPDGFGLTCESGSEYLSLPCGAYLCLAGRCRSCGETSECLPAQPKRPKTALVEFA